MRNLGLALVLIASIAAPHVVWAKKHAGGKRGRSAKAQKHGKRNQRSHQAHETIAPSENDALAGVVSAHKRQDKPVMTAAVAPPAEPAPVPAVAPVRTTRNAEPAAPNAPMHMDNQTNDDEVPGTRKKR